MPEKQGDGDIVDTRPMHAIAASMGRCFAGQEPRALPCHVSADA